jgi:hypothetical protein
MSPELFRLIGNVSAAGRIVRHDVGSRLKNNFKRFESASGYIISTIIITENKSSRAKEQTAPPQNLKPPFDLYKSSN